MQIYRTPRSVGTLVELREAHKEDPLDLSHCVFCTISPNPKVMVDITGRVKRKMPYCLLPVRLQYEYCMKYLQGTYMSFFPNAEILGTAEFDKSNKLHFHFLMFDPKLRNPQHITGLQVDIKACPLTINNMSLKKGKHGVPIDHMNNIVKSNRSMKDHLIYLDKDYDPMFPMFENYYIGPYINTMISMDLERTIYEDERGSGSPGGVQGAAPIRVVSTETEGTKSLGASAPPVRKRCLRSFSSDMFDIFNHV